MPVVSRAFLPCVLLLAVFFVGDAALALAEDTIQGAYGFTLGEQYTDKSVTGLPANEFGLVTLEPTPPATAQEFDYFAVNIDQQTREIVQIVATKMFQSQSPADALINAEKSKLEARFGASFEEDGVFIIEQGARRIHLTVQPEGGQFVAVIVYQDDTLLMRAATRSN